MREYSRVLILATAWTVSSWGSSASACDLAPPPTFAIVPNPADETPPSAPEVRADTHLGGPAGGGNCQDLTYIDFVVGAVDELNASGEIGYIFESDEAKLFGAGEPVAVDERGHIRVYLNGILEARGSDFRVRVSAVDRAGNVSLPTVVGPLRRSDAGCNVADDEHGGSFWPAAMLAMLAVRRRLQRSL